MEVDAPAKRKSNEAFSQSDLAVVGDSGHDFQISIRVARDNVLDFSVILVFIEEGSEYNLIRLNGRHKAEHTNMIERDAGLPNSGFKDVFHVHQATERYQLRGLKIEGFAEPTACILIYGEPQS